MSKFTTRGVALQHTAVTLECGAVVSLSCLQIGLSRICGQNVFLIQEPVLSSSPNSLDVKTPIKKPLEDIFATTSKKEMTS